MPARNGDHELLAVGPLDLENVARAEILDRNDGAEHGAVRALARQADHIGMIIFALAERRQRRAGHGEQGAAQRLGGGAVADFGEAGDGAALPGLTDSSVSGRSPA